MWCDGVEKKKKQRALQAAVFQHRASMEKAAFEPAVLTLMLALETRGARLAQEEIYQYGGFRVERRERRRGRQETRYRGRNMCKPRYTGCEPICRTRRISCGRAC